MKRQNKRIGFRLQLIALLCGCFFLFGCPPPERVLIPEQTNEITVISKNGDANTVKINFDNNVQMEISGRWSPNGSIYLDIDMQNNSDKPFNLESRNIRFENESGQMAQAEGFSEIVEGKIQDNGNRNEWKSTDKNTPLVLLPKKNRSVVTWGQFAVDENSKMDSGKKLKLILSDFDEKGKQIEIWFECEYR